MSGAIKVTQIFPDDSHSKQSSKKFKDIRLQKLLQTSRAINNSKIGRQISAKEKAYFNTHLNIVQRRFSHCLKSHLLLRTNSCFGENKITRALTVLQKVYAPGRKIRPGAKTDSSSSPCKTI